MFFHRYGGQQKSKAICIGRCFPSWENFSIECGLRKGKYRAWLAVAFIGTRRAGQGRWWRMGGIRGVKHYMQRVAIQGSPTTITAITNVYQPNAEEKIPANTLF